MANVIKLKNSGTANSAPTSLEVGELAINYADGKIYYKNSSNVIVEFSSASGSGISVSETPPASPSAGDLWFESDTGKTFIYYDSFWVETSGADGSQGTTGSTGPEGGTTTLTTKGDILARDTSASVRLPVGTNGKVLTANSSTTTGLEWVTPIVYATVANLSTLSNTVTGISDNANTLSNTVTALSGNVSTISNTVNLKANIASPTFTGIPTAPTAANTVSNTQIATTAYVKTVIGDLINSAPSTLDTLGEIATSLANNESLSSTLTTSIALKAPLADPTFTGTVSGITKTMVGLGSVDNTTDLGKPISNATQTALDLKAPLANATFTGTIVLPATTSIANVTSTEIGYLDGVTSSIQSQLDAKEKLIPYSNTAPVSPTEGDLWVDSTVPTIKAYIGSSWVALGGVADDDQPILAARIFS